MDELHDTALDALGLEGDYITRGRLSERGHIVIQVIDADEGCTVGFAVFDGSTLVTAFHWSQD